MKQSSSTSLHAWLRNERPRERLLKLGAKNLTTAELLAICFGSGRRGEDAVAMARRLLSEFGSLDGLLQACPQQLKSSIGLGSAKVAMLKAIHELTLRYSEEIMRETSVADLLSDTTTVSRYIQSQIGSAEREIFACLYLDTRHRLLSFEPLFSGTVNRAFVFPREILKRALENNAAAVVLAHNHPSGVAEPSHADILMTQNLLELLGKVDVKVLDHIVVSRGEVISMASRGLISC